MVKKLFSKRRICPVCCIDSNKRIFLKKNIDTNKLSNFSFSSRKFPEFFCFDLDECIKCKVIFAPNPPSESFLETNYNIAEYDSSYEAYDAANTYYKYLSKYLNLSQIKKGALDIGTGDGIFLSILKKNGFKNLRGIEPSINAINKSKKNIKKLIIHSIFKKDLFPKNSFGIVSSFMTLEHVLNPNLLVNEAYKLLNSNGIFVTVTHNRDAFINRLLGKKSPIIDIEHMQLFNPKSIDTLLKNNNFSKIKTFNIKNTYRLEYWIRLLPIKMPLKKILIFLIRIFKVNNIKFSFYVGNQMTIGFKD